MQNIPKIVYCEEDSSCGSGGSVSNESGKTGAAVETHPGPL